MFDGARSAVGIDIMAVAEQSKQWSRPLDIGCSSLPLWFVPVQLGLGAGLERGEHRNPPSLTTRRCVMSSASSRPRGMAPGRDRGKPPAIQTSEQAGTSVSGHPGDDMPKGTLASRVRQAGLKKG